MAFVWDVLRRVSDSLDRPLLLFVHDVENMICGSFERLDAFEDAFGSRKAKSPPLQVSRKGAHSMVLPLVLIGGCSLGESGTHITTSTRSAGGSQ